MYNKGGVALASRKHMSPSKNPPITDKEVNINLAQEILQGFARIETEITNVKTELTSVKTELTNVKTKLDNVETEVNNVKNQMKVEFAEIKADIKVIDNKLDMKIAEVEDIKKRLNTEEATRSRLISNLIAGVIGSFITVLFASMTYLVKSLLDNRV
jgi:chromosome segregation ATPase